MERLAGELARIGAVAPTGAAVRTAYRHAALALWLPALPCADWRRSPCWGCGAHSVPPSFFNALAPSFALRGLAPQPLLGLRCAQRTAKLL